MTSPCLRLLVFHALIWSLASCSAPQRFADKPSEYEQKQTRLDSEKRYVHGDNRNRKHAHCEKSVKCLGDQITQQIKRIMDNIVDGSHGLGQIM